MGQTNATSWRGFVFTGFSRFGELQLLLFALFLSLYLVTLTSNVFIIVLIRLDSHLHTPMYLFLSFLSFSETCYTLGIIPRMLSSLVRGGQDISFMGCAVQMFFSASWACTNCFLLAVMGFDRYVAICTPLRYASRMVPTLCAQLVGTSFLSGYLFGLGMTLVIFRLPFCSSHEIQHFFCDTPPVLSLACGDIGLSELGVLILSLLVLVVSFSFIIVSYTCILAAILRIPSTEGQKKAFPTCASRLAAVVVHYGCASSMNLRPKASYSLERDQLIAVTDTVVTPLLNPIIYSLRNRAVQTALRNAFRGQLLGKG
ncbi:Olfactory receptor 10Z1 [Camelus dromedarius]|uniref:Olfactory receptor n=1 Tax=Camelus dromedarius TaxID=9838 RepID=A0A5N4CPD9_CAMDR|nr:olfactory receptor 10Z1 [Camelus dromedarius]KAB1260813.1 Olfactory receptor 10Z1 [Camelus dromedarius]